MNVIVVGWGILAADIYPLAANNTRRVGEFLGDFLEFLNRESNLEYKDVHISGHSLGSHVAGFAGAYLDGRIGRITGAANNRIKTYREHDSREAFLSRCYFRFILTITRYHAQA